MAADREFNASSAAKALEDRKAQSWEIEDGIPGQKESSKLKSETFFLDDVDRQDFLKTLAEAHARRPVARFMRIVGCTIIFTWSWNPAQCESRRRWMIRKLCQNEPNYGLAPFPFLSLSFSVKLFMNQFVQLVEMSLLYLNAVKIPP
jgi:hypothetical protein